MAALIGAAFALAGCGGSPPASPASQQEGNGETAALIGQARAAMGEGDLARSGPLLDQAREAEPDDPALWVAIARLRFRGGEQIAALDAAERALELGPRHAPALLMRAQLVRDAFGFAPALPWFEAARAADPGNGDILLDLAATQGEAGEYRAMLDSLDDLAAIAPQDRRGHFLRAVLAARAAETVLARSLLERSGLAQEGVPAALVLDALIDLQQNNPDSAAITLDTLARRQPGNVRVMELHARAMWLGGRERELTDLYAARAERRDASAYLAMLVGRAFERLGKRAEAAPYLARAFGEQGETLAVLAGNAGLPRPVAEIRTMLDEGREGQAMAKAEALRQEFPASSDIRALGGDVALAAGEAQDALTLYREASRVRRPWPLTRKAVHAYRMIGDDAAAYALLVRHAASEPNNPDALLSLARESAARADWLRTALLLDRAIALGAGNDPALLRLRAEAAAKLDRKDEAQRFSARVNTLDPPAFVPR